MHDFSLLIANWYRQNGRELPWRSTDNPYYIWLSEIILQQTRVNQGLPYYEKFVEAFPTIKDLAESEEQKILNLWQGLGYYSRARNLHFAAQQIMHEYDGIFPSDYKGIKSLKGIGDYTAAAIASFAFKLPHAVVDGNVYRVLSRYFNDPTPIDSTNGKKIFAAYAAELLPKNEPDVFNQAIMELGALVCTPKNPDCENCPVNTTCLAREKQTFTSLPVKAKKTKVTKKHFHYLYPSDSDSIKLVKRTSKGIWQNMYQFPLIETKTAGSLSNIKKVALAKWGMKIIDKKPIQQYDHKLSHQHIKVSFWKVDIDKGTDEAIEIVTVDDLQDYPLPRVITRFLEDYEASYEK